MSLHFAPDGLPTDDATIDAPPEELSEWIVRQVNGQDERWSARSGDDPADSIRILLNSRPFHVQAKVVFALAIALRERLTESAHLPTARRLLALVPAIGFLPPNPGTQRLAEVLDAYLSDLPDLGDARLVEILRARAEVMPPPPERLWRPLLKHPHLRLAAFQSARRFNHATRLSAFQDFVVSAAQLSEPALKDQTRILLREVPPPLVKKAIVELMRRPEPTATVAATLFEAFWPQENIGLPVAAFLATGKIAGQKT